MRPSCACFFPGLCFLFFLIPLATWAASQQVDILLTRDYAPLYDPSLGPACRVGLPRVNHVCWSPDGTTLACACADNTIKLWDVANKRYRAVSAPEVPSGSLCYSPDGKILASIGSDGVVRYWDPDSLQRTALFSGPNVHEDTESKTFAICFSPDGTKLADLRHDGKNVEIWNAHTSQILTILKLDPYASPSFREMAWTPDGEELIVGAGYSRIQVFRIATGEATPTVVDGPKPPMALSPDGKVLATWCDDRNKDRNLELWNLRDGYCVRTIQTSHDFRRCVSFSPDGKILATSGDGANRLNLWDVTTGNHLASPDEADERICQLAWRPDGKMLASVDGYRKLVKLWDVAAVLDNAAPEEGAATTPEAFNTSIVDGHLTIIGYTGAAANVVIPGGINGRPVIAIADRTFKNDTNLTSVTIPDTVTSIGSEAFRDCLKLSSAVFAGNAPTMGKDVFLNAGDDFKVSYHRGATGFGDLVWRDSSSDTYPTNVLEAPPAASGPTPSVVASQPAPPAPPVVAAPPPAPVKPAAEKLPWKVEITSAVPIEEKQGGAVTSVTTAVIGQSYGVLRRDGDNYILRGKAGVEYSIAASATKPLIKPPPKVPKEVKVTLLTSIKKLVNGKVVSARVAYPGETFAVVSQEASHYVLQGRDGARYQILTKATEPVKAAGAQIDPP